MPVRTITIATLAAVCGGAALAQAQLQFVAQQREVSAFTSFDGQTQTVSSSNFDPFIETVVRDIAIPNTGERNRAVAGISCTFELNRIRINGALEGQGSQAVAATALARSIVNVTFTVDTDTFFSLRGDSIDASDAADPFELKLVRLGTLETIFLSNNGTNRIDTCDFIAPLAAGQYQLSYTTELSASGDSRRGDYDVELRIVPAPAAASVLLLGGAALRRRRR